MFWVLINQDENYFTGEVLEIIYLLRSILIFFSILDPESIDIVQSLQRGNLKSCCCNSPWCRILINLFLADIFWDTAAIETYFESSQIMWYM